MSAVTESLVIESLVTGSLLAASADGDVQQSDVQQLQMVQRIPPNLGLRGLKAVVHGLSRKRASSPALEFYIW